MRPRCSVARVASSSPPHVCRANIAAVYLQRETTLTAGVTWPNTPATFTLINQLWEDRTKKRAANNMCSRKNAHPQCVLRKLPYKHTHTHTHGQSRVSWQIVLHPHKCTSLCITHPSFPNKNRYVYRTRQIRLTASLAHTTSNRMAHCGHYCGTRFTSGHKK